MILVAAGTGSSLLGPLLAGCVRCLPNHRAGVVEKPVSGRGSVKSGLLARESAARYQPRAVRGGRRLFFPFQGRRHAAPVVTGAQGKLGSPLSRDGRPLPRRTFR